MQVQRIQNYNHNNISYKSQISKKSVSINECANLGSIKRAQNNDNSNINFKGLTLRGKYLTGALSTFFAGVGICMIDLALIPVSLACWAFTSLFISAVNECDDEDFYRGTYRQNMWK